MDSHSETTARYEQIGEWQKIREVETSARTMRWEIAPDDEEGWYVARWTNGHLDWINHTDTYSRFKQYVEE